VSGKRELKQSVDMTTVGENLLNNVQLNSVSFQLTSYL